MCFPDRAPAHASEVLGAGVGEGPVTVKATPSEAPSAVPAPHPG